MVPGPYCPPSKIQNLESKILAVEIQPGDRVGIIGGKGAGKSMLQRVLSRITEPTTRRIKIKGRVAKINWAL
jgi:lipopolysaccharide transport system ATP-binding protein